MTTTDDLVTEVVTMYSRLDPVERQYSRFYMNGDTRRELVRMNTKAVTHPYTYGAGPETMFGIPVEIDPSVPFMRVQLETETPQERRLKEFAVQMAKQGKTANMVLYRGPQYVHITPTIPTLKSLVNHWKAKALKRVKSWRR